ncbi:hypothetical protein [Halomarina pelagica]|uniref:hypothetical protein n=1 Tax=Halomarina pelagica TaxID=2961599 RepID=UPI0020C4EDD4|nr:hypothetical protein [Halomarina sp. BND7]
MTLTFDASERFLAAAAEWGDRRHLPPDEAFEVKVEQALLEIEYLVSGATEVEFDAADGTVAYEPSPELDAFLADRAADAGLDPSVLLGLYVDLFAAVFLDEGEG